MEDNNIDSDDNESLEKSINSYNVNSDDYRMLAAISFSVMLLLVGVPLWWKTTEVERSPLPYPEISSLDPAKLSIATTVYIYTHYPTLYNSLRSSFLQYFELKPSILKVNIVSMKLYEDITVQSAEEAASVGKITIEPGSLLLIQVAESDLDPQHNILVSSHSIVYFTNSTDKTELVDCVMGWMMEDSEVTTKMSTMLDPQSQVTDGDSLVSTRLRAALSYDFVFSIVVSDPARVSLSFDIKHLITKYVDPLLIQLNAVGNHKAKSQWIHFLDLSSFGTEIENVTVISAESLPHIITPLEKRLGSGVCGVAGCVQLVLYVTPCNSSRLVFGSDHSLSMTAPPWGSVQMLNPTSCNESYFFPRPAPIMATFISQIHSLLGFTNPPERLKSVSLMRKIGPELRQWQVHSLYRMRTLEQLLSASLTLKSLAKLLGEISNIVINAEVARCVEESVANLLKGFTEMQSGKLIKALSYSQQAFVHAEKAFTNPSLLALLYFPDDQKYAVYIPLFLPIMIPVFMSLKPIYRWMTSPEGI